MQSLPGHHFISNSLGMEDLSIYQFINAYYFSTNTIENTREIVRLKLVKKRGFWANLAFIVGKDIPCQHFQVTKRFQLS